MNSHASNAPATDGAAASPGLNGRWQALEASLACPRCRAPLKRSASELRCDDCDKGYPIVSGVPRFRDTEDAVAETRYLDGWKGQLRRRPHLYRWVFRLLAPVLVTGPSPVATVAEAQKRGAILDIGGGNDRLHPDFVNLDILPYPEVDIVADAGSLPLQVGSVQGIVSVAVLEHVPRPDLLIAESARVLAAGGQLYFVVPFLQPFHAAPHDYRRWTRVGLCEELQRHGEFEVEAAGVYCGPASAMTWVGAEFLAHCLSLGNSALRGLLSPLFQVALSPFKWLDLLLARLPNAEQVASAVYVSARRTSKDARSR